VGLSLSRVIAALSFAALSFAVLSLLRHSPQRWYGAGGVGRVRPCDPAR
jgi:hypothetical protein